MTVPSTQQAPLIVVGAGLAAGTLVTSLREAGDTRKIVIFGNEMHPPHERPPLSKGYLRGESTMEETYVNPLAWYGEHDVELFPGVGVLELDLDAHTATTAAGAFEYSHLVLATGARARGHELQATPQISVHQLRTIDDALALRTLMVPDARLVLVGGGWIGLEVAASARSLGAHVTVVEQADQLLGPVLGPQIGAHLKELHESKGVEFALSTSVVALEGDQVQLSDGRSVQADVVVVGIGAIPNDDLATAAGLDVDNGVVVDASLVSSHPDVFAIGDVANHQHPVLGERIRVEHWQNAISQARCVAKKLRGEDAVFDELPFFFSDQYDTGLEFWGHVSKAGFDEVQTEPGAGDGFSVLWSRKGHLIAAAHVDDWDRSEELKARVSAAWNHERK